MSVIDIIEFIKDVFGLNSPISIEKNNEMLYQGLWIPATATIQLNERLIKESAEKEGIDIKTYAVIIYLHEFGHATDSELVEIDNKITQYLSLIDKKGYNSSWANKYEFYSLKAEVNAWRNAEELISPELMGPFIKMKNESLNLHKSILKTEKKYFKLTNKASIPF